MTHLLPGSFRTESGTTYIFDETEGTLTRSRGVSSDGLRRDGEAIKLVEVIRPARIGEQAILLLDLRGDGILTVRRTSTVVEVA